MRSVNLFCYIRKMNICMTEENSMKHGRYYWSDYTHSKKLSKDFETNNLGKYHDRYVKSNTLLLGNVSENVWNICLEIYYLDLACFLSTPG